ncbi:4998_t:CDS:1, partial [Rhizophagus irregularis]
LPNEQNFTRAAPFSDTESEEGAGGAAVTFGIVKPELQRVNITNE